ncbi:MAG: metallophosphoesterase [Chthoniobacterales bacterium]
MMPPSRFRILHLSDFHFQHTGDGNKLGRSVVRNLNKFTSVSTETRDFDPAILDIGAVVLSGDFRQQRQKEGTVDWRLEAKDLVETLQKGLRWDRPEHRSRILLVPGNHDATRKTVQPPPDVGARIEKQVRALVALERDSRVSDIASALREIAEEVATAESRQPSHYALDWSEYNGFAGEFYAGIDSIKSIPLRSKGTGEDLDVASSMPIAYLSNRLTDLGIVFILLHAYAEARTHQDDATTQPRVQLPATVGRKQLNCIDTELARLGFDRDKHHTVMVLHHHLFPMRSSGVQDLERRDILTDLPELADRLPLWNTSCVLHGHRHRPFFGVYRVVGISDAENREVLDDESDPMAFDPDYELVACGIGQACNEEVREDGGRTYRLLPSLQLVDITPNPHRFFEARIVVSPYQLDRNKKWIPVSDKPELQSYSSELVLPRIQRALFDAECFSGDEISVFTSYPLIPGALEQFREWFATPLENVRQRLGIDLFDPLDRENLFENLIKEIREINKKRSIFSILPFQLAGIYGFASMFFAQAEVNVQAIKEFEEPQWLPLLEEEPSQNDSRPDWLTNHLESANYRIAEIVNDYHEDRKGRVEGANNLPLRIVDLGAGTGRTIRRIVNGLSDHNVTIAYRGLEISGQLSDKADTRLRSTYRRRNRLTPLDKDTERLVVTGEICAHLCSEASAKWFCNIDVVVAAYCLHHIPNNYRIWKMVADGSLFCILNERYFNQDSTSDESSLLDGVEKGAVFPDVPKARKTHFFNYLDEVHQFWRTRLNKPLDEIERRTAAMHAARLEDYLPNRQRELYGRIYEALKPGGRLIVADPNGFSSTFNRVNIFADWRMAIAHFAEWTIVTRWLHEIGFMNIRVVRQMRLKTLQVVEVDVPNDWLESIVEGRKIDLKEIFTGNRLPFEGLEVEDQHLGYIVSANKPGAAISDSPRPLHSGSSSAMRRSVTRGTTRPKTADKRPRSG